MANQQSGNDSNQSEFAFIAALLVGAITCWVIWTKFPHPFIYLSLGLDWIQIEIIKMTRGLHGRGLVLEKYIQDFFAGRTDPYDVKFRELVQISSEVGRQTRLVLGGVIIALSALVMTRMKNGAAYKGSFTLGGGRKRDKPSFAHYQAKVWRSALASANFDPSKAGPNEDPAAMPLYWMRSNKISLVNGKFDETLAEKVFEKQLGGPWIDVASAPLHVQAFCAICIAAARDVAGKKAAKTRGDFAEAYILLDGEKQTQRVKEIIAPILTPKNLEWVAKVTANFAFINPAMIALIHASRKQSGVLASAEVRWIKASDRSLWYAINNEGRRAFHIEAAGIVSHYFAEHIGKARMIEPYVKGAVDGLRNYLDVQGVTDIDQFFESIRDDVSFDN